MGKQTMATVEHKEAGVAPAPDAISQRACATPHDLERGPDTQPPPPSRRSRSISRASGIGSALSSNSSIMGDPNQAPGGGRDDVDEEWGPRHPCYPHLNPHVPVDSAEYAHTRIIRVRRNWLLQGDLAPTFSNLYPEILDPAGFPEAEFRRVVDKLNGDLVPAFDPYGWRNLLDGVLAVATGWIWEDFGLTAARARLRRLERWIDQWNAKMADAVARDAGPAAIPPKIISLHRTGYMTLDIQIPDPEIAPAPSPRASTTSRPNEPAVPAPAVTT